jgi:DNA modification methylase
LTGFTTVEIDDLLRGSDEPIYGLTDPDAIPEPPDEPKTQPGDLIILGDHQLLCGDSANADDVARLLGGHRVQLVNTDPPYNVKVEPRSNNAIAAGMGTKGNVPNATRRGLMHHQGLDLARRPGAAKPTGKMRAKDRALENDFVADEEFRRLLAAWFGNIAAVLEPGRSFYIWGGYSNLRNYPAAIEDAGLYFSQGIIWDKQWPVLTRKDFMGAHEWAYYGWREGAAHWFNPEITNATDLWRVKKVTPTAMVHLTEKPVELAELAMEYSSRRGEHVLDLFGGSGSTLIAAERLGRKAFLMEIDPAYCDVIVQRWQEYTGRTAEGWRGND